MIIGVIGGSKITDDIYNIAYEVGKLIALNNWMLICGGLGGVMEAASKGAFENKGLTIGILPSQDKSTANKYVIVPIATNIGFARNYIIVQTADILIAIDGKEGTLNEITAALNMKKKVIGLRSWNLRNINIPNELYVPVNTPEEAIAEIKRSIL